MGYAVLGRQGAWVYTGDTGPNPALWQRLSALTGWLEEVQRRAGPLSVQGR